MASKETDEGYVELQMDGKQVVIVIAGILLLCAISFYFGRRIGRAEAARVGIDAPAAASALPVTIDEEENAGEDLTFFDTVGEKPQPVKPLPVVSGAESASQAPAAPAETEPAPTRSPETAPSPAPEKSAAETGPTDSGLEIQVGVFSQRTQAESLAQRLRAKGYRPSISPTSSQGKTVYRVRVGGYATRAAAESAATRLQEEEKLQTWIPPQGG